MADTVSIVNYYSVTVPNKTGEGAKLLAALKDAGVNLAGFWGYPVKGKKAQFDLMPADPKAFAKAVKKLGLEAVKASSLVVSGDDHAGALAEAFGKLSAAGVGIFAAQAIANSEGRYATLIQVAAEDVKKAHKALK